MFYTLQVKLWRRSYDVRPPPLEPGDDRYPGRDRRYQHLRPDQLPLSESLADTVSRLLPIWQRSIALALRQHRRVLVVAHGNSLRALVKYLDSISDADITRFEIPTGLPLIYELDSDQKPLSRKYLVHPSAAKEVLQASRSAAENSFAETRP